MRGSVFAVLMLMPLIWLGGLPGQTQAGEYTIGVLAKRGAARAIKQWGPTADYLNHALEGDRFTLLPLGFDEVDPAIEGRKVDFFLVNSSMFVTAQVRFGASPIATMVNSRQGQALRAFGGVIFTYIDRDDINHLSDLRGKRFMAVEESSFGGWQMALKVLLENGVDPARDLGGMRFGGTHDNVVYSVQNDEAEAGTVRTDTLERMAAAGDIELSEFKIIHPARHDGFPFVISTELYPEWPLARLASTPDELALRVTEALFKMPPESEAARSAKIVGWAPPLDYNGVRQLQQQLGVGAYQ